MGLLSLIFLVCSLRTNVAFFIIFLTLTIAFGLLTGAYWAMAEDFTGNAHYAHKLLVVSIYILEEYQPECYGDLLTINLGRWGFGFCNMSGRVVHFACYFACHC